MIFFVCNSAPIRRCIGAVLFFVCASSIFAFSSIAWASPPQNYINPDYALIEIYKDLAKGDLKSAEQNIDKLLQAYPNFQLGHLIRGDIIAMRARPIPQLGGTVSSNKITETKLKDLRAEAQARFKAIIEKPSPDLVPANLLAFSEEHRYAIVMDAERSRVYLYENQNGMPKLITDYYVSQGKLGVEKIKEGDQKTPLGVYLITSRMAGEKLPDFYGPGSLPINYPNEWDKVNQRTGHGIWLHGVPSQSYSRPPLASDGCIVLSNPDFLKLADTVEIGKTPVIVTPQIQFIKKEEWEKSRINFKQIFIDWQKDLSNNNTSLISRHYSNNFKSLQGDTLNSWVNKHASGSAYNPSLKIKNFSQYIYPAKDNLMMTQFQQELQTPKGYSAYKRIQIWKKEANHWKIVFEDMNPLSGVKLDGSEDKMTKSMKDTPSNKAKETIPLKKLDTTEDKATKSLKEVSAKQVKETPTTKNNASTSYSANEQKEVLKTVNNWVSTWSAKNTKAYLGFYAKDFKTPNGESRNSWMEDRRSRIEGKSKIHIRLDSPNVSIKGNTATVKFRQSYEAGSLAVTSRKTLIMVKEGNRWLIKEERTGS